jgi:hypothetical protein
LATVAGEARFPNAGESARAPSPLSLSSEISIFAPRAPDMSRVSSFPSGQRIAKRRGGFASGNPKKQIAADWL